MSEGHGLTSQADRFSGLPFWLDELTGKAPQTHPTLRAWYLVSVQIPPAPARRGRQPRRSRSAGSRARLAATPAASEDGEAGGTAADEPPPVDSRRVVVEVSGVNVMGERISVRVVEAEAPHVVLLDNGSKARPAAASPPPACL